MMQKFKHIWVVILLLMLIAPADAAFRLYGNITRADGATAVSGGLVEIIRVTGTPIGTSGTPPFIVNGSNSLSDGTTNTTLSESDGKIKSDGLLVGSTGTENVIVRAWYGRAGLAETPSSSMYYGYSDQFPLGTPMMGVPNTIKNISAIYRASAPDTPLAPTVRVWYTDTFSPRVDVTCTHNSTSYNSEVVRTVAGDAGAPYVFTVSGAASRTYYSDTPTITISDLPVGSYAVSAQERNWFNLSAPSPTTPINLLAGVGGAGGGVYNLGINFNTDFDTTGNIILSWKETGGISDFDIYYTTGDPTLGPWTTVTPKPSFTGAIPPGGTTLTYTTAGFSVAGSTVYYRVIPVGANIATSPREVAGKYTYNLRRSRVGSTGINSFALPFSANWVKNATTGTIDYLGNGSFARDSLGGAFEYIGGWNVGPQRDEGVLIGDPGADASRFLLEVGRGYQIGVGGGTDAVPSLSWTVIGIK